MKKYLEVLQGCPLFQGIQREDLSALLACLEPKVVRAARNQPILREGEPAVWVGILLSGQAQVLREDYDGNRTILAQLEPGELLDTLDKAFSDWLAARVRGALEVVKANGADIFSLEEQFTRLDAGRAALLSFPEDVKFFLGVDAKVERSYDLSAAENLHGGEM